MRDPEPKPLPMSLLLALLDDEEDALEVSLPAGREPAQLGPIGAPGYAADAPLASAAG